jgi:hypothetical protein
VELEVVGKDVLKQDAFDKVTGSGQYTFDLKVTGMLHGKFLWSPVPQNSTADRQARRGRQETVRGRNQADAGRGNCWPRSNDGLCETRGGQLSPSEYRPSPGARALDR